jgi:hypothetical protein
MERRSVLSAFTAACIGVLLDGPCAEFVRADNAGQGGALLAAGPSHFETSQVEVSGSTVPCNPCKQPSVALWLWSRRSVSMRPAMSRVQSFTSMVAWPKSECCNVRRAQQHKEGSR